MTKTPLPPLPRRVPATAAHRIVPVPPSIPAPGAWAAPTREVLRSLEAALARWSV